MWAALGVLALLATLLTPLSTASAHNSGGNTQPHAPHAPVLTATTGDGSITLTWKPSAVDEGDFDGGSPITSWQYQRTTPASNLWVTVPGSNASTRSYTVTGLDNGKTYVYKVRAINSEGNGDDSNLTTDCDPNMDGNQACIPSTTPPAPTMRQGLPGNAEITLQWSSTGTGGSDILYWQYQQKSGSGDYTPWSRILDVTLGNASQTDKCDPAQDRATVNCTDITGLTNGTVYHFKVRAVNKNGGGAAGESGPVLAATKPGTPRNLSAEAGDKTATLSWVAGGNGGSPITSWQYHQSTGSDAVDLSTPGTDNNYGLTWETIPGSDADTTSYTVAGLANASTYVFVIRAVNAIGTGTPAQTSKVDPGMVPGKPTGLEAVAAATSVTLTWIPPLTNGELNDGGSPLSRYEYAQKEGSGAYGDWKAVPANALFATTSNDDRTLTETQIDLTDETDDTGGMGTVIRGLTTGKTYSFKVRAVNATGGGSAAELARPVNPSTQPAAPGSLQATQAHDAPTGTTTITLSWTAGNDGGAPVTKWQYKQASTLTALASADTPWVNICDNTRGTAPTCASTTSVTLPRPAQPAGLRPANELVPAPGSTYYFVLRADNGTATSPRPGLQSGQATVSVPQSVPSAPPAVYIRTTVGTQGSESITLTWRAAASGGSAITDYEFSQKAGDGSWGTWNSAGTDTNQAISGVNSGIKAGTTYQFRVRAKNQLGTGAHTESPMITPGAPGTPGADGEALTSAPMLSTTASSTGVSLALVNAGGSSGTGNASGAVWQYSYKVGDSDYGSWSVAGGFPATALSIDGLTNGVEHQFRVRAVQGTKAGPVLESRAVTPGTQPAAPVGLKAEGGNQNLTLTWTSGGDGGSAITEWHYCRYQIQADDADTPTTSTNCGSATAVPEANSDADNNNDVADGWFKVPNSGATTTEFTIGTPEAPLVNGTKYTYRVRAKNGIGDGLGAPAQANTVAPGKAPTAPVRVQVTADDASVTITTTKPSDDGDSAITSYEVRKMEAGGAYDAWETLSKTGTGTVTGLTNGVTYTFEVRARNAYGAGPGKESASVTPVGAPPPGMVSAEAGNGTVTLSWSSGGSGGSDITGWQYRQQQGGSGYGTWMDIKDSIATTTSHTVTGLSNGISYTFQVRAVNKLGTGDSFESGSSTPSTVPPQPASVTAERGDGQVTLTWTAGDSGDAGEADYAAPTTEWHVRMKADDGDYGEWMAIADSDASTTSYTATGLTNGTAYVFQVRAMNVMGNGEATTSNAATPATTPSAPTVSVTDGDGSAVVSWTAGDDGGSAVTSWHIQVSGGDWVDMTARGLPLGVTAVPIPGLDDGTAYTFGVRGVNDVGEGAAGSADLAANSAPAAPTVSASGSDGSITVSWTAGDDGGSSVTGWHYRMKVSISDYGDWMETDDTSVTLSDLDTGTGVLSYTFQVRGVNGVGAGDAGTSDSVTPVADPAVNGIYYSGVVTGPNFCAELSLGGARLFAFDSDGDGVADTCALPFTKREAIARQNAVATLASQHAAAYVALVNAACATVEGDAACGGDTLASPGVPPINDGGPYYSGTITGPSYCANMSLGGPVTYPFDSDGDGVADTCAYPYTTREAIARQLAGDVLAALNADAFKAILQDECRRLGGADYGDDPAHLANDACA